MGRLGIFVNRQTLSSSKQLDAIIRCRDAAEAMGHTAEFIFPTDIKRIPQMDAVFIRARTDPMNTTFVAAKMAEFHGIPVVDDPRSIHICSDKVNMYLHLMNDGVRIPETRFLSKAELTEANIEALFEEIGSPLVLKEPSTSFSARVEKADDVGTFLRISKRFLKLSDWIVAQEYVESKFDWRIGVLDGKLLYACKYIIPPETFKIQASVDGHIVYCTVKGQPPDAIPPKVMETGLKAARAIGDGLYGVDIKDNEKGVFVIEVNDNPSLESTEDEFYPDVYHRIISHLLNGGRRRNGGIECQLPLPSEAPERAH